jgi:hypothetical protein
MISRTASASPRTSGSGSSAAARGRSCSQTAGSVSRLRRGRCPEPGAALPLLRVRQGGCRTQRRSPVSLRDSGAQRRGHSCAHSGRRTETSGDSRRPFNRRARFAALRAHVPVGPRRARARRLAERIGTATALCAQRREDETRLRIGPEDASTGARSRRPTDPGAEPRTTHLFDEGGGTQLDEDAARARRRLHEHASYRRPRQRASDPRRPTPAGRGGAGRSGRLLCEETPTRMSPHLRGAAGSLRLERLGGATHAAALERPVAERAPGLLAQIARQSPADVATAGTFAGREMDVRTRAE